MRLITLLFVLLAGCATPDHRQSQFASFNQEINAQREANTISYADGQRKKYAKVMELWPDDYSAGEFFSYSIMLAEKVDKGELSPAEYHYLATAKAAEIRERVNNDRARRAQAAAAILGTMPRSEPVQVQPYQIRTPVRTNCYTDSLGYTNCTTQ